jgi:Mg-chelatase subunit ChlD
MIVSSRSRSHHASALALFTQLEDPEIAAYHTPEPNEIMTFVSRMFRSSPVLLVLLSLSVLCVAQDKKKINYALFLDDSGSMRSQLDQVVGIGRAVVQQIHEHGPVSVFDFTSQGSGRGMNVVVQPRLQQSQDLRMLERTIDNLYIVGGQTTLRDAIGVIADSFEPDAAGGVASERVIILVTDGEDRTSRVGEKQLIQKLKDAHIQVYAVGLIEELEGKRSKAVEFLTNLTRETGGRAVFPKSAGQDRQSLLTELAIPIQ